MVDDVYDVVVVGGGAAGLSGALTLARAGRTVLVVDGGEPRNAASGHVHNYLGREGSSPGELLGAGREDVTGYGGRILVDRVVDVQRKDGTFHVELLSAAPVRARRLLVTTGATDELPDLPGLAARWGRDVLHCPYCHGREVAGTRIGVLGNGPLAVHQALLWRQWSDQVVLLSQGAATPAPEQTELLAARGVLVVEERVSGLEVTDDRLTGVRLETGELVPVDALVATTRLVARVPFLAGLGLEPVELEMGGQVVGLHLTADPNGASAVPGVWLAGNVTDLRAGVIGAAAGGFTAAAMLNADLVEEDGRTALEAYRERRRTLFEEAAWEERYLERPLIWSGAPNPQLVREAADLPPGRALDVGAGEGADAVWLASRGWQVTAADISRTALARAQAHAAEAGAGIADRISWMRADLRRETPPAGAFDLVSAQFMQLPPEERQLLFAALAEAVVPGGTLLVVGHHPADLRASVHRMHFPEMMFTAEEIAAALPVGEWDVGTAEKRPRSVTDRDGRTTTIHDAVLVARRR